MQDVFRSRIGGVYATNHVLLRLMTFPLQANPVHQFLESCRTTQIFQQGVETGQPRIANKTVHNGDFKPIEGFAGLTQK